MTKYGIVGSRRRDTEEDFKQCEKIFLSFYKEGDEIVSGGCPKGGDRFAEIIAKRYGIPIKIYFPNWDKHGKAAGFVRNTKIAEDSDIIIAVAAADRTGGTEDTIKKAEKLNKKIVIVPPLSSTSNSNTATSDSDIDISSLLD
jgi:predicted Rossmann fold nucleotide-binding protein DprA/Smf involved in DNA uptake